MEENIRQRTENYISAKNQHPAWILLATRRAPLVLGCLKTLFEKSHDGIPLEEAIQSLSGILIEHVSQEQYDINQDTPSLQASRELREWIKRRLIVERDGRVFATDALEVAITFVESLDNRFMTSTASRLSTVQREIENLETWKPGLILIRQTGLQPYVVVLPSWNVNYRRRKPGILRCWKRIRRLNIFERSSI